MIRKITYVDDEYAFLENELGEGFMTSLAEEPLKDEIMSLMATSESITVNLTFTKLGRYISSIVSSTLFKVSNEEPPKNLPVMTLEEVSKRSGPGDCCIIVDQKVYDVTSYLSLHPGTYLSPIIREGGSLIIECLGGKDATFALKSIPHSEQTMKDLQKYVVGTVKEVCYVLNY